MKYLQKLGKSLMLPVACLPVASILMGIGYWIDPSGWGANNIIAAFLIKAGGSLIDNMGILFAIGVGVGMSDDNDGTAGLAGLVSWLMITTLLSPAVVAMFKGVDVAEVPAAGSIVASLILFFVWPIVYGGLVSFGEAIVSTGAIGSGIYTFFNRLLIPTGLHHALNSVFWFDVAGINDIGNFWAGTGTQGVTGMYMTGFFPVMMFGLPAGALAMYHTAKDNKKKAVYGLLLAASISAFFTGVTEPLEFSFMFLAPGLYLVHAILSGISAVVCTLLPVRCGFNFSAGFVDWFLSFKAPMAENPLYIIPIGLVFAVIYYVVFRFAITKFNLKTPGREDDDAEEMNAVLANNNYTEVASIILKGVGGKENITSIDNCVTRLRLEIKDQSRVDEKLIKSAGVSGVMRPGKTSLQVIVGTQVQFVADEFKKLCR